MKPLWFATGVLLIILGVTLIAISNFSRYSDPVAITKVGRFRIKHEDPSGNTVWFEIEDNSSAEISGYFSKGEYLLFHFIQAPSWSLPPYELTGEPTYSKIVVFSVNSPSGNSTYFFIQLAIDVSRQRAYFYDFKVINDGALIIDNSTNGHFMIGSLDYWGGITPEDGQYIVKFEGAGMVEYLNTTDLPVQIWLYKRYQYCPLRYFLPVGGGIVVGGLVIFVKQRNYSKTIRNYYRQRKKLTKKV